MKTFMGYRISDESTNPRVLGAKFIQVRVGLYREVDAAKELLEAAVYKDDSLQAVQARVQKMRELCLSSWFEHAHYPDATFHLQGSCAEGHWYALHFECSEFHAETLKILTKLKAAAGSGGDRLERLITALQGAGGVEVGSVEISYDGRRDWMDCRKDELDAAKRRAEQAQEFNQITN